MAQVRFAATVADWFSSRLRDQPAGITVAVSTPHAGHSNASEHGRAVRDVDHFHGRPISQPGDRRRPKTSSGTRLLSAETARATPSTRSEGWHSQAASASTPTAGADGWRPPTRQSRSRCRRRSPRQGAVQRSVRRQGHDPSLSPAQRLLPRSAKAPTSPSWIASERRLLPAGRSAHLPRPPRSNGPTEGPHPPRREDPNRARIANYHNCRLRLLLRCALHPAYSPVAMRSRNHASSRRPSKPVRDRLEHRKRRRRHLHHTPTGSSRLNLVLGVDPAAHQHKLLLGRRARRPDQLMGRALEP